MKTYKLLYLGEDQLFYGNLVKEAADEERPVKKWSLETRQFQEIKLGLVVHEVLDFAPDFILLDMSRSFKDSLKLIHFLSLTYPFESIKLIGLTNTIPDEEQLPKLLSSRLIYFHIKSMEKYDFLNSLALLIGQKAWPELATAYLQKESSMLHLTRLGYITENYLHIESNFQFPLGTRITLGKTPLPGLAGQSFVVQRKMEENLYYPFQCAYDLEWDTQIHIPPPTPGVPGEEQEGATGATPQTEAELKKQMALLRERLQEKIEAGQHLIRKYIQKKKGVCNGKRTRVLVIDTALAILEQSTIELDLYPYSLRMSATLDPDAQVISRTKAGIICLVLNGAENNLQTLEAIISKVQRMEGYRPIIILFNCKRESHEQVRNMNYNRIILDPSGFNFDILIEYSKHYENKDGRSQTHDKKLSYGHLEARAYLDKSLPESLLPLQFPIVIKNMNESLVVLESKTVLPLYEKFLLDWPFPLVIVVLASLEKNDQFSAPTKGKDHYLAFICGLTERERQEMRVKIFPFTPRPNADE